MKLAQAHYAKNNWTAALQICNQYLAYEPVDESAIRLAMKILWQTGKRQKALSMYQELAATQTGSYDAKPDTETIILYQNIRSGSK